MSLTFSEGFQMSTRHNLDFPSMTFNSIDLRPGYETEIGLKPIVYNTTEAALQRLESCTQVENELFFLSSVFPSGSTPLTASA